MASRNAQYVVHPAMGGLDTTKAPTLLAADQLSDALNIEYFTSGARKKRLGSTRYNATAITGTGVVTALKDFWRYGASLTPTQKFVGHSGTRIVKDDGDGVWDVLNAAWGTGTSNVCITIAGDYAVFSADNGDAPRTWDQTTEAAVGGTPPTFAFSSFHLGRLWAAGVAAAPSTPYFSAAGDINTWSGADAGTLPTMDAGDGDRIMGISEPWFGRLYWFKGPNFGSVFEISGSSVSTFAQQRLFTGAPCVAHQSIITTPTDIFWASRYGFHSLKTTQAYGDTQQNFISAPIQASFNDLNPNTLSSAYGFYHPRRNIIGWAVREAGKSDNSALFVYNFKLGLRSIWKFTGLSPRSVAVMRDPAAGSTQGSSRMYLGDIDGFVIQCDNTTLTDDNGSAYTASFSTPTYVDLGEGFGPLVEKQLYSVTTFFAPKGNYTADLTVDVDGRTQSATVSFAQTGGALDSFVLNTDILGGSSYDFVETPMQDAGRAIKLTYSQAGSSQDMEIYGYALRIAAAETHALE